MVKNFLKSYVHEEIHDIDFAEQNDSENSDDDENELEKQIIKDKKQQEQGGLA